MVVIGEIRVRSCLEMRECATDTHVWSFYLLYILLSCFRVKSESLSRFRFCDNFFSAILVPPANSISLKSLWESLPSKFVLCLRAILTLKGNPSEPTALGKMLTFSRLY
jgi:hypothetical protein